MGVENYHVIELVGEGSFGKVYKGRRKFTGQILRKVKHENIIEMLDSFESPQEFCVVTEFAQGELFEILEDDKHLPFKQLLSNWYFLVTNSILIWAQGQTNFIAITDATPVVKLIGKVRPTEEGDAHA
ncbi:hypothetical protein ACLB2K_052078 [Fragaria x ananassa]